MRVAVVGHVEWIEFARVDHVPARGEIEHAIESWEDAAGGGAVAAVQLAKLAGECLFLTALGGRSTTSKGAAFASKPRGGRSPSGGASFTSTPRGSARSP